MRSYKLLSDGRRQIGAFHLIGDIFGLENGGEHRFTTEAVVDTTVRLIKRQSLESVAESDAMVARNLLSMTTNNLQHAEDHMLLLGRKTSLERVAAFLLEMDKRLTAAGVIALPMSRRDIADYLGLTLETVSRALSRLHELGILGFIGNTPTADRVARPESARQPRSASLNWRNIGRGCRRSGAPFAAPFMAGVKLGQALQSVQDARASCAIPRKEWRRTSRTTARHSWR
ncbi:hypothetical protein ABIF76_006884 [Bradyrhizobium ottawaense]